MTPAERTARVAELRAEADRLEREGKSDALIALRDEVAKMAWPPGAAYCARLIEALNATLNKPYSLDAAIKTPAKEPTGAELAGKACEFSDDLQNWTAQMELIRFDPGTTHPFIAETLPWRFARLYREDRP